MDESEIKKLECPWASVKKLGEDPEWPFSEASLRYMLFHSKETGMEKAVKRIGKKILIHKGKLLEWLENYQERKTK